MEKTHLINEAIKNKEYCGSYGGSYVPYYALSHARNGEAIYRKMSDINRNPIKIPYNDMWKNIVTFNPYGMVSEIPTIASTKTTMSIPELDDLVIDNRIINSDGSINCIKIGVEYAWDLAGIAKRLRLDETEMRKHLSSYTENPKLLDPKNKVWLPPCDAFTVYVFGDLDSYDSVTARVHDECSGSDTFGTHICSCRPYLVYGIQAAVECAQKGGLGVVVYCRKEGRSLGEVIKFLVYNGRKNQEGGDRAETYFDHTKRFCGVEDARFQELMPDIFSWLGIKTINNWMSMSHEKSSALRNVGIEIGHQFEIPIDMIAEDSKVELEAKVKAGYYEGELNFI